MLISQMNVIEQEELFAVNKNNIDHFDFKCKFTRPYLNINRKRGIGKGLTPSSYVGQFYYAGNKHQSDKLIKDLERNPRASFKFLSAANAIAFYPIDMLNEDINRKYKLLITFKKLNPDLSYSELKKMIMDK